MHIAVNTRFLLPGKLEGFGVYTDEIMKRMTASHPANPFTFYFDRKFAPDYLYSENVNPIALFPPARHPVLFYVWFQMRLKRKIQAARPDVFFSPDSFMPLGMDIPSVIAIHDVAYMRFAGSIGKSQLSYYERFMPKFVEEAAHIITVSEFSKREICHFYDVSPDKITVIYNGVDSRFKPVEAATRARLQNQYSDGKPYFLYVGAIHPRKNVVRLIQAFDQFKQNTKTEMQLLIAGRKSWHVEDVLRAHKNAKHSHDIRMIGYVPHHDLPNIVGNAFALTYVSLYEGFGLPVIEAMASGVPVITSSADSTGAVMAEVAGDAALTVNPESVEAITDSMEKLTSDTALHAHLRERGLIRAGLYNWDIAAAQTFDVLKKNSRSK